MKIKEIILAMRKEAQELEHIGKHGSSVTSMSEDAGCAETAKVLNKYIALLESAPPQP